MATNLVSSTRDGSFLLEMLYFAGWNLRVRDSKPVRILAKRGDVEIDVAGSSLPDAAGTAFARAMRSSSAGGRRGSE
jgi:hypothetical protein